MATTARIPILLSGVSMLTLLLGPAAGPLAAPASAVPRGALTPTTPTAAARGPHVGAAGIGDPLFPTLGNGGYDARHYSLRLRYATAAPSQGIDGTLTMRA